MPSFIDPPRPRGGRILTGVIETDGFDTETKLSDDGIITIVTAVIPKIPVIPGQDGVDGQDGIPGPPGPAGPPGATGAGLQGPPGPPGQDGIDGVDGTPGPSGNQGPAGATGATGAGVQGPPGQDGADGNDGSPGPQGPSGPTGATGNDGAPGTSGMPGMPGADGQDGQDGIPGPAGAVGATGPTGPTGPTGATGASGNDGAIGPIGFPGQDGADGNDGIPGAVGPQGIQGIAGPTGATGAGLQGPPGQDGGDGQDGAIGPPGPTGPQGIQGVIGPTGIPGDDGFPIPGQDGSDGYDGIPGPPGVAGPTGPQGPTGATGTTGTAGASGNTPPAAGIILSATNQSLQIITATGADIDIEASFNDLLSGVTTPGSSAANITTATTTTLVAAPAASTQRTIVEMSIVNSDASLSQIVTVQKLVAAATFSLLVAIPLMPSERIEFTSDRGWRVFDAAGREKGQGSGSTGIVSIQPGQFIGLNIDAGANGPAIAITGAQGGENIGFDTWVTDATSAGNVPDYAVAAATTGVRFNNTVALNLQGLNMPRAGKELILSPSLGAPLVTLEHASSSEATAGRKFQNPSALTLSLFPGENARVINDSAAGRMRISGLARARSAVQQDGGVISPAETLNIVNGNHTESNVTVTAGVASIEVDFRKNVSRNYWYEEFDDWSILSGTTITTGGTFMTNGWSAVASVASTASVQGWFSDNSGVAADGPDHPGHIRIGTGNTTANRVTLFRAGFSGAATLIGSGGYAAARVLRFEGFIRLSTNLNNELLFGMADQAGSTPTNCVCFKMSGGNLNGIIRKAGVQTTSGTFFSVTNSQWFYMKAEQVVAGTWEFFAGATVGTAFSLGTIAVLPSSTVVLTPYMEVTSNLSSATTTNCDFDYCSWESQPLAR